MRLDKYLKVSRLIKRRTVASQACQAGKVQVNGAARKPGYDVQPGDHIEIALGERTVSVEVLSVEEPRAKAAAGDLIKYL